MRHGAEPASQAGFRLAGQYLPPSGSICAACPSGKFKDAPGGTFSACLACAAGKFNDQPGQAQCKPCAKGSFSEGTSVDGTAACIPCPAGTQQLQPGQSGCVQVRGWRECMCAGRRKKEGNRRGPMPALSRPCHARWWSSVRRASLKPRAAQKTVRPAGRASRCSTLWNAKVGTNARTQLGRWRPGESRLRFHGRAGVVLLLCWFFETDLNPPVVTILGRNPLVVEQFASFVYAVASATDAADGTVAAERRNSINTSMCRAAPCGGLAALARAEGWPHANADEIGAFVVNYTATDRAG